MKVIEIEVSGKMAGIEIKHLLFPLVAIIGIEIIGDHLVH